MCFHLFGSLNNAFPAIGNLIYSNVELSEEENDFPINTALMRVLLSLSFRRTEGDLYMDYTTVE